IHYEQLKVGAGVLIERDGCLLLLRRAHPPFAGRWNLPAGYVEANESPRQAAVREAHEETGIEVEIVGLADVYYFADDPRGNGILIVYRGRAVGGALAPTAEARNPTYFPPSRLPSELSGGGHDQAILAWKSSHLNVKQS
ncbi:MAG TPA: NUDIX domain-containing protein, partial [Anaerolineae bacterium]|nr:NUDIX domain-containing protein [Anaerolineae bacterium]